ncbi:amino acid permease [Clostridium ljungdahlii]|uniref:Predicted aminoacid permease n=1 Tax=Clostridium ljungdahlii (strain ATCC 55383 / DSM 13528 / PETC) TaxID=748727 RepID=D8GTL7_CLOLD|nr:amino acid permease [Clostridium ljungdahlii]ADK14666.1 predicted aminoacid permease [Clostridium ljungdahlii DSM 13528]OAA85903.1 putative transport protein YifK [Clostridium ljungdahlii DSM 13528]
MDKQNPLNENLERGLQERHIQLIAIGGAIGVGLFLGSATAIQTAGPAILLVYALAGIVMFFIMRALGELAISYPVSGSFSTYASEFIGPLTGYLTGWTYWFMWIVTCMAEITAVGIYVKFWLPSIPQWIPALIAVVIMTCINLIAVKAYGEFEFWFALIKVVTIISLIIFGLLMIIFGLGNDGKPIGFSNLWTHGGFFPKGIWGVIMSVVMVMFSYLGMELIGITAGEAKDPQKTIPSAINKVLWRILVFYVGALFIIMSLYPWNSLGTIGSPFVLTFSKLGIVVAAGIINFVVLTAALSSCNSGIFSTGRMLYNLSLQGTAPKVFNKLGKTHVPTYGIIFSSAFMLIGVFLNYMVPSKVFTYVTSVATFGAIWVWSIILIAQMNFRKKLTLQQVRELKFPMVGYPYINWISLSFLVFVVVTMFFNKDTLIAIIIAPIWFTILIVCYYLFSLNKKSK